MEDKNDNLKDLKDKFDVLCNRWDDMNDTLKDLENNYDIYNQKNLNDILGKCNRFFILQSNKKQGNRKDIIDSFYNFYKGEWNILFDCISSCRLPKKLVDLMNELKEHSQNEVDSAFIELLTQVIQIAENDQMSRSTDSESIYISEDAFDFFPAIFFSLGVIKRRLLSSQDEKFKGLLEEFEKLMKEIDKVNYCKRLYLVMDGQFRNFIQ